MLKLLIIIVLCVVHLKDIYGVFQVYTEDSLTRVKRVVGGYDAPEGTFPYQVSLRKRVDNFHFCSGSILSASVVVTAAHCVYSKNSSSLVVVTGTNKLHTGGTHHLIKGTIIHENFNRRSLKRDIALLIIHPPITFSKTAQPIRFEAPYVESNINAVFSGWGEINESENQPYDELQYIHLRTINNFECRNKSRYRKSIAGGKICTLTKKGEGACIYDSGGPLVVDHQLVGILSWGEPCARNYPDVYTRVSSFVKWIKNNIALYSLR